MKMSKTDAHRNKRQWLLIFDDPGAGKAVLSWYLSEFGALDGVSVYSETGYEILSFFESIKTINVVSRADISTFGRVMIGTSFPPKSYIKTLFSSVDMKKRTCVETWALVDRNNLVRERFFLEGKYFLPDHVIYTEKLSSLDLEWFVENAIQSVFVENPYLKYLSQFKTKRLNRTRYEALQPRSYVVYAPDPISTFSLEDKFGFNELEILIDLCGLFMALAGVDLIFLKHKNQIEISVPFEYQACFKSPSVNEIEGLDNIELLKSSLAVISFNSSILNEASAVGVPTIRALWRGCDSFINKVIDNSQSEFSYNLLDRSELIPLIEYLRTRAEREH